MFKVEIFVIPFRSRSLLVLNAFRLAPGPFWNKTLHHRANRLSARFIFLLQRLHLRLANVLAQKFSAYPENNDRATATATAIQARQQLAHVRRRISITLPSPELIENGLQFIAPRDNHSHTQGAQFEQKPKIVQIPVEKRILVVPPISRPTLFLKQSTLCVGLSNVSASTLIAVANSFSRHPNSFSGRSIAAAIRLLLPPGTATWLFNSLKPSKTSQMFFHSS